MEAFFDITHKHPVVFWEISLKVFSKYHFRLQLPRFTHSKLKSVLSTIKSLYSCIRIVTRTKISLQFHSSVK